MVKNKSSKIRMDNIGNVNRSSAADESAGLYAIVQVVKMFVKKTSIKILSESSSSP